MQCTIGLKLYYNIDYLTVDEHFWARFMWLLLGKIHVASIVNIYSLYYFATISKVAISLLSNATNILYMQQFLRYKPFTQKTYKK